MNTTDTDHPPDIIAELLGKIRDAVPPVRARADAAPAGPWEARRQPQPKNSRVHLPWWIIFAGKAWVICEDTISRHRGGEEPEVDSGVAMTEATATFVAAARTDVPLLIDLLERAVAAIELLRGPQLATDADLIRIHAREVWSMAKGHDLPLTVARALENLGAALGENPWP